VFTEAEDIDILTSTISALIEDGIVDNFFQRLIVATGENSLPQLPAWASLGALTLWIFSHEQQCPHGFLHRLVKFLSRRLQILDRSEYCGRVLYE